VPGTVTKFIIADSPSKIEITDNKDAALKIEELKKEKQLLKLEQMQNKDFIFLHGIEDNYANLHFKVNFLKIFRKYIAIILALHSLSEFVGICFPIYLWSKDFG